MTPNVPGGRLLIEGWRGVGHSFSIVNQWQLLALGRVPGVTVFHRDLRAPWRRLAGGDGFRPEQQAAIDAVPPHGGEAVDCIYRIAAPFQPGRARDTRKTVTFMVTEVGLTARNFARLGDARPFFTRDRNAIVTPSRWSRDALAAYGFPADRIHVVPHGVDAAAFHPLAAEDRRAARASLGIGPDETVFLNVGAPFWNKGIDTLLTAFASIRGGGCAARLILKDQRHLHGRPVEQTLREVGADWPAALRDAVLKSILVVPGPLAQWQMRLYYGLSDAYVAPYRAEGFNLPALEAIACGTPVIVTAGGATEEFVDDDVAIRIPSDRVAVQRTETGDWVHALEPRVHDVAEALRAICAGRRLDPGRFRRARSRIVATFGWDAAVRRLLPILFDGS